MKRFLIAVSFSLAALVGAFAQDFAAADSLHDKEKYADELALLRQGYSASDPQAAVVYRIIRAMQEVAVAMPAGKDKTAKFDETINFGKPLLDTVKGKGAAFCEGQVGSHNMNLDYETAKKAIAELG